MILLIGEGSNESMSRYLLDALREKKADVIWLDQNSLPIDNNILLYSERGKIKGNISFKDGYTIDIDKFKGIYTRLSSLHHDLDLNSIQTGFMESERHIALNIWLEHADAVVINRTRSQFSNSSKLYQTWIVKKYGFKTPDCLITNDSGKAQEFIDKYKSTGIIYKSASAERSKVKKLDEEDMERLTNLQHCPTLFQSYVPGTDLRVHTLISGEVFATEINSESSDYRYDKDRSLRPVEIPDELKETCVNLTRDLGLYLSGIDIRRTPDNDYYCFEVNPSPAFAWYEDQTGQPISQAVAELLINGKENNLANLARRIS